MYENEIYNMYDTLHSVVCCCDFLRVWFGIGRMFQDTKSHLAIRWRNRRLVDGTDKGMRDCMFY